MTRHERRDLLRLTLALPLLPLAACGFQPLYGKAEVGVDVRDQLAAIDIEVPRGRLGQDLKTALTDDLNPGAITVPRRYALSVSLGRTTDALAIQLDATITRYDLTLDAAFSLREQGANQAIYRNKVRRVASYNVSREPYATQVAEEDADRRAAVEVSRQIAVLLTVYFREQALIAAGQFPSESPAAAANQDNAQEPSVPEVPGATPSPLDTPQIERRNGL